MKTILDAIEFIGLVFGYIVVPGCVMVLMFDHYVY
jgi:hypothetical protein